MPRTAKKAAAKKAAAIPQEATKKDADKIKLRSRKGVDRLNTEVVVNGRYVGTLRLTSSEYTLLAGLLLEHDIVEERITGA